LRNLKNVAIRSAGLERRDDVVAPFPTELPHPDSASSEPLAADLALVARGDEAALRRVYEATAARVLGIAAQILRDRSAAEDVVVEVYSQVWRQADRYEAAKGSVATWIGTLARTRAIDLRRAGARHARRETEIEPDDVRGILDPAPAPFLAAAEADRSHLVRAALERLPGEQRRALEAAFYGGLSHTEIAAALGAPLGTVKTRIRSGLSALRLSLAASEGEIA
jgi:RNA polymerase sigma-70 factor (ECF subfamily)